MLNSLKFQITATLVLLLILFAGTVGYTFLSLKHQRDNDMILTQADRLQLTAQRLSNQAMRYKQHAPRDYESYYRDLELYYKDLLAHVDTFDMVSDAFMQQDFAPMVTGLVDTLRPRLGAQVLERIAALESTWQDYRKELFEALGPDAAEPRLEWGAEYIIEHNQVLERAARELTDSLHGWAGDELARIERIQRLVMAAATGIALALVVWLFVKVLAPLNRTLAGFRRVARGDFGIQVAEQGSREAVQLTRAFNHLSSRLHVLFDLIERLQEGSDLDQTLSFVSREFHTLLRLDWIGMVFVTGDGQAAKLEAAYMNGVRERPAAQLYRLQGTLLERAMAEGAPLHIADMRQTARDNPRFQFLRALAAKGLGDAVFLPLTRQSQSPVPGVLVFAARAERSYDPEQLQFLDNIAQLITHSFGRTAKLAESARLAAVGGFASGIAHELRTPLATIGMALDHFSRQELPPGSAKRVALAVHEAERMGRLLDEMLLYARPLRMQMETLDPAALLNELAEQHRELFAGSEHRLMSEADCTAVRIVGDRDRLTQVWLNLTRNAGEAAAAGTAITWRVQDHPQQGVVELQVHNAGEPIPAQVLSRLGEPFFTTKPCGTGLGLAIVRRVAEAHGGELKIRSDSEAGTRVSVFLPRIEG